MEVTFNSDGSFVVRSYAGDDFRDCRDQVKAVLGLSDDKPRPTRPVAPVIDIGVLRKKATAADIWARSVPIAGTLAERYLASRGLSYDGDALRYHAGIRAMVAQITDAVTGEPMGVHRTFLDPDGNRTEKKMLGPAGGGVVRLTDDADVEYGLAIAEGIETALAAPFRPAWACLSAGNLARFPVLGGIGALTIFADNDKSGTGERDAFTCAERWHASGREVEIRMPAEVGKDYADLREAA
ncbi:toprim domain-containing protein [Mesorhizobium sp. SP-1A]|uniref:DUF7146 domain-containing protein n=1 Tax=Mesorhizobium sp. SP-1A TaxID=3077840 RepID=UPI0028F6D87F|nr:toprim domain-containing protein [Mesorhizobium sp. SP-1A]